MARIDDYRWYQEQHEGETKKMYLIHEDEKTYRRTAYSAEDAIERLANQYGWGELHDIMYDADTRGENWCRAHVAWAGEIGHYMIAEIAE